ncbi:carboxypeptidase [Allokutzneria sp. A3M-2-11 16]|uniref:carboxypeptidase n=1 Tax=Allokutzneria sp. A3M-2-11 16 TaxID=2962043 RepID=UPI0020B69C14|nr:carboxypeptidase [Allokutzneria sp. A3M-2-11 16]MCP3801565.1 carboxypeptidase [Allokutzneria sp. A3M-2-11 16]
MTRTKLVLSGAVCAMAVVLGASGTASATPEAAPDAELASADTAKKIRDNAGINLLNSHVSGRHHPASTARTNIADAAAGRKASTSPWSDVGVKKVTLTTRMLNGMLKMRTAGYKFRVTTIVGGDHSSNSRHYAGLAFDVDQINGRGVSSSHPSYRAFMNKCRAYGATEVLGPGNAGHSGHIHCAWPR